MAEPGAKRRKPNSGEAVMLEAESSTNTILQRTTSSLSKKHPRDDVGTIATSDVLVATSVVTRRCLGKDCGERPLIEFLRNGEGLRCISCTAEQARRLACTKDGFLSRLLTSCYTRAARKIGEAKRCTLTLSQLTDAWDAQSGCCGLTGVQLQHKPSSDFKASPERRDSSQGYVIENVILIAAEFNVARQWTPQKIEFWWLNRQITPQQLAVQDVRVKTLLDIAAQAIKKQNNYIWRDEVDGVAYVGCNHCETIKPATEFGKKGAIGCYDCALKRERIRAQNLNHFMKRMLKTAKASSKHRKLPAPTITLVDLINLFTKQHGLCHWSSLPMVLGQGRDVEWLCSLERLDVKLGYSKDNIAFICLEFNSADFTKVIKHSNGGSAGWSKAKINLVLESIGRQRAQTSL